MPYVRGRVELVAVVTLGFDFLEAGKALTGYSSMDSESDDRYEYTDDT